MPSQTGSPTKSLSGVKKERKLVSVLAGTLAFLILSVFCFESTNCGQVSPSSSAGLGKTSSSSGKDSSSGSDTESSVGHHHSHNHNYHHRHHRQSHHHGASGKTPSSSVNPSTSAYGYPEFSPMSYNNPADSYYEPRYYERPSREFSARSTGYPALAASSAQVGFTDTEYGGLALATGHGGGHGGHGHGDGYGHGQHTTYYKTVNHKTDQSSLGLLGLLGLLSLLSNVLLLLRTTAAATTTMAPAGGRRKRDTMVVVNLENHGDVARKSVIERLSHLILPSLNVVGHAKDGRIPLNCTYQEVCKTNRVLIQIFGPDEGRPVASLMSTAITKLLADNNNPSHIHRSSSHKPQTGASLIEKLLAEAGLAGRNGENCEIAYPTCAALSEDDIFTGTTNTKKRGSYRLPLLISPESASAIILGQK